MELLKKNTAHHLIEMLISIILSLCIFFVAVMLYPEHRNIVIAVYILLIFTILAGFVKIIINKKSRVEFTSTPTSVFFTVLFGSVIKFCSVFASLYVFVLMAEAFDSIKMHGVSIHELLFVFAPIPIISVFLTMVVGGNVLQHRL